MSIGNHICIISTQRTNIIKILIICYVICLYFLKKKENKQVFITHN